jgi:hypothetical protein
MKLLKILIFSGLIVVTALCLPVRGQGITVRLGIYDFTDITARDFYHLAPVVLAGGDVWKESRLALHLSGGLAYNAVQYNDHLHHLVMAPLFLTMNYDLVNPDSKIWPAIAAGFSLTGKVDKNSDLNKTHYSLAYGYIVSGRLNISLKKDLILIIECGYNFLMPQINEELDISGVITSVGLKIPFKKNL